MAGPTDGGELEGLLQAYIPSTGVPRAYLRVALEQVDSEYRGVLGDTDFKELVDFAIGEADFSPAEIAARCALPVEAVLGWAVGRSLPDARTRRCVRQYFDERLAA